MVLTLTAFRPLGTAISKRVTFDFPAFFLLDLSRWRARLFERVLARLKLRRGNLHSFRRPDPAFSAAEGLQVRKTARARSDACQMHRSSTIRAERSNAEAVADRLHRGMRYQHVTSHSVFKRSIEIQTLV